MNIAIISKSDHLGGGASRIATELADLLLQSNYSVSHWIARSKCQINHCVHQLYGENVLLRNAIGLGHFMLRKLGMPELLPIERLNLGIHSLLNFDLIHVHDITSAVSVDTLAWLAAHKPLVWTLHDCSPFTGGCIYPMQCNKFIDACGNCPHHGEWPLNGVFDFTRILHSQKKSFALNSNFTALAPSEWVAGMARSSRFFPKPEVVSNGIDLTTFRPLQKKYAKERLGLDPTRIVIVICSSNLADKRKGLQHALDVLHWSKELNPLILAIGIAQPEIKRALEGFEVEFTGFLQSRQELAGCYSAGDALFFFTHADNQPLTVMEAMACGTPIIGFDVGGMPELVSHLENGYLVKMENFYGLKNNICEIISDRRTLHQWSVNAVRKANKSFGYDKFLEAHIKIYSRILKSSNY